MGKEIRSADVLVDKLLSNPEMWAKAKEDPAAVLRKLAKEIDADHPPTTALESDITIYRMVVAIIGVVAVIAVIGAIWVVGVSGGNTDYQNATALLTALVSISSAAIGALAGLLSPMGFRR